MPQLMLGQLAKSCAGRDKGRFMLIVDVVDENYVYLIDGDLRRVDNPKKKKIKHLKLYNKVAKDIAEKIKNNRKLYNEEVRKALNKIVDASFDSEASNKL